MQLTGVDCHFHVIAPESELPLAVQRSYTPKAASLAQWQHCLQPLGFSHGVVVQPSFYGTDNRVMVKSLHASHAAGNANLLGIAAVQTDVSDNELEVLANAGVRGIRLAHFEAGDPRARHGFVNFEAFKVLEPRLHQYGLHLNLFTDSLVLPQIYEILSASIVPVVIDHMGRTPAALGVEHKGMQALKTLLSQGHVWVKLSGVANISEHAPNYQDARLVHDALVAAQPDRLLWGSDWPHTKPVSQSPETKELVRLFGEWVTDDGLREKIINKNPVQLYRFKL